MNNLDQLINLKVKITNLLDETTTATIYAVNPSHEVLALKISPTNKNGGAKHDQIKIINTAFIKSLQVLPPFPKKGHKPANIHVPKLTKVDVGKFEAGLDKAVNQYRSTPGGQSHPGNHKRTEASPLASKIFNKLSSKLGKENVQWNGNETILAFKEIAISRPYALNKVSNSRKSQGSKHLNDVKSALRESWLEVDNAKRGG